MSREESGILTTICFAFLFMWQLALEILRFLCCCKRRTHSSLQQTESGDTDSRALLCCCMLRGYNRRRKTKSSDVESQVMDFERTQDASNASRKPNSSQTNSTQYERSSMRITNNSSDGNAEQTAWNSGAEVRPAGTSEGKDTREAPSSRSREQVTVWTTSEPPEPKLKPDPSSTPVISGAGTSEPTDNPGPFAAVAAETDLFGNEVARRTFLEMNDEYSETEIIKLCQGLNGRISHLSGHLIREKNRMRGLQQDIRQTKTRNPANGDEQDLISKVVQAALGREAVRDLAGSKMNARSSTAVDHSIRDGLDAWSTYCIHLAMTPMLFGLKLRSHGDIEHILKSMIDLEPDMAQSWGLIRGHYEAQRGTDERIEALETVGKLENVPLEDVGKLECTTLERIYRHALQDVDSNFPLQIPLHWRALLHAHELGRDSYKDAISRTEEILRAGLLHIFTMAGVERPDIANNANLSGIISNIVLDAATLAKYTKTSVFSQNTEIVMVNPGELYDEATMNSEDELGTGKVKCTVRFGLRATDTGKNEKWLLKTEVLLT